MSSLAEAKERARIERLNRIAPGWKEGSVMEPVKAVGSSKENGEPEPKSKEKEKSEVSSLSEEERQERDQMQLLVEGLEALDSKRNGLEMGMP